VPITKDQAREIAEAFLNTSHALGQFRFANWAKLTKGQRRTIEDAEWDLLNYSSNFTTSAVGIALADLQADLAAIRDATAKSRKVIETLGKLRAVLDVAAGLIVLGGAIASENPAAIASAARDLLETAEKALSP
jgi:hypothetical protein